MARRKKKTDLQDTFKAIAGFRDLVDETVQKITGKPLAGWFQEFQQQPRELPLGKQQGQVSVSTMSLANAYMVLGLPPTASPEEVKRNYRNLARLFHPDGHPDAPGEYEEAMVLLNQAFERIKEEKGVR